MPFTFSHPAIILPLVRYGGRYVSATGLIIGSMAPDFEYFIRMKIQSNYSHTIAGLFCFDLPVALLVAFIYHLAIRNALCRNLPKPRSTRLVAFTNFNWKEYFARNIFIVAAAILTGAASHLLWDSFTHKSGYFVAAIPDLTTIYQVFGGIIPVYKLLQHVSTFIGAGFIALSVYLLPKHILPGYTINGRYWLATLLVTTVVLTLRLLLMSTKPAIGIVIVTTVSGAFIALTITGLIFKKCLIQNNPQA